MNLGRGRVTRDTGEIGVGDVGWIESYFSGHMCENLHEYYLNFLNK